MHKQHLRDAASAIAMTAVSIGVVAYAAVSNSGSVSLSSVGGATGAPSNSSQARSYQDFGVDSQIVDAEVNVSQSPTYLLAVAKKTTVRKVVRRPKPVPPKPAPAPVTVVKTLSVAVTFYGAYDNDPAGSLAISNPVIHKEAGGVGSYANPLTFASPAGPGAYPVGAIIYVPFLQKYFIHEDLCGTSWTATSGCGAVSHVDLYMGNPSTSSAVINCEEALTPNGNATIILNPASNLPYDPSPLWNSVTGACAHTH